MSSVAIPEIDYPDRDGKPMSDNTKQARWIFVLYGNLLAQFRDRDDVFVAADNLWYPVEGNNKIRQAPDVYVVFGRPKGDRGSYKQWEEGGVPLTVVFEILSPGNERGEEPKKHLFYEEYGVEEYYVYDPDADHLTIYTRGPRGAAFRRHNPNRFVSPRLGIRFDFGGEEMVVIGPNGQLFLSFEELKTLQEQETTRANLAESLAAQEAVRAKEATARAEQETVRAKNALAELEEERRINLRIRELSRKQRAGVISPDELRELVVLTNGIE
ncbi:MAG: Uma2 family endonuclease [Planctomycetia bacterium]|nr:Uma2 family endonuclease [Planctomycetia bacterium]